MMACFNLQSFRNKHNGMMDIHLAPVLLGDGIRLFDHLGTEPIELESIRAIDAPGVTHLGFRVVK